MKDFTKIKEKGVTDCDEQIQPIHLLELFGGIGAPRRALENVIANNVKKEYPDAKKKELREKADQRIKSIDYVEVLPYAVQAYNQMFNLNNRPQDIRLWNLNVDILVHGSPCFTADTKVLMSDGTYKRIDQVKKGDYVSYNGKSYAVTNWWNQGVKDVITLQFNEGESVTCTPNHKFLCLSNNGNDDEWIEAQSLLPGNRIIRQNDGSGKFVTNVLYPEAQEVFDIEVEDVHCFVIENGSIVHNCQDFSREGKNDINSGRSILYERTLQILDPDPEDGYRELTRQPKVVIWENVPNMAYSHAEVLRHYLTTMEKYGYTNTFCGSKKYVDKGGYISDRSIMIDHMIDASDYGIPQARERFFCVSVLNEYADRYGAFVMPQAVPEDKRYTLKQYLDLSADMSAKEVQFTDTELSITKKVGSQWYVRQAVKGDFGAGPGYVPVNEFQRVDLAFPNSQNRRGRVGDYASTLTTSPRQGVLIGDKFRTFTAKEMLRLMGFRDSDYENMVKSGLTDKQIAHLAGNSICVPVLEHIFNDVLERYPELSKPIISNNKEADIQRKMVENVA